MTNLYLWAQAHTGTFLALGLFVAAMSYIIAAAVFALWTASEERKQAEERQRLDKVMQASHRPAAQAGCPHRRVG